MSVMSSIRHRWLAKKVRLGIQDKAQRVALAGAMRRGREGRALGFAKLEDPEAFKRKLREMKESSIEELDSLLEQFIQNATKRGAKVRIARSGEEAVQYILDLAESTGARTIIKSKSLTSDEIEMNTPLELKGYEVVETDLGERIVQLAGERPIHLVAPAAHKTVQQVAELFTRETGEMVTPDMDSIMRSVRGSLRQAFLRGDIGVSGVNVAVAKTGTIIVLTNEGNARLVTSIPRVHVAIMGMEKIVPTLEDAIDLIQAIPMSATGEKVTTYVSLISGKCPMTAGDSRAELHIVILDNGRSRMRSDEYLEEALFCIRCGACMNICPTYEVVGGHVFGYIYPGPIGIPWTAGVHGIAQASEFAPLCIACGLCREMCPVDIDMPLMISRVKELDVSRHGQAFVNGVVMRFEGLSRLASASAPLSNWILRRRVARILMEKLLGIERRRKLPRFHRQTFMKWHRSHRPEISRPESKVVYFVDSFANYNDPEIGKAAVYLLEEARVEVAVPPQKPSGMPYISYGELSKARSVAQYNVESLSKLVKDGYEVVTTEPTAAYCLKDVYPRLLGTSESELVSEHTCELMVHLMGLLREGRLDDGFREVFTGRAGFHISCHQRGLSSGEAAIEFLRMTGLEVQVIQTGTCCGMGGTFGLKAGDLGYGLSVEVGAPLFDLFKKSGVDFGATESSVCRMQLEEGTDLRFEHPVKLLRAAHAHDRDFVTKLRGTWIERPAIS